MYGNDKKNKIVIGLKEKPLQMHATKKTYLIKICREKCVLAYNKMSIFMNDI